VTASNVDLVRSLFAAWECGDCRAAEWADPKIEYVMAAGLHPAAGRGWLRWQRPNATG
jgi:hypothetical protein